MRYEKEKGKEGGESWMWEKKKVEEETGNR
jgi:hypothetical protein